jgi:hypothetical protein
MSQTITVTVKGFSVTKCIDPKSKTEIPAKFKPAAVSALKAVSVDPPKGKTLNPYSVDVTVVITAVTGGVKAQVSINVSDQDPYSKKDKMVGAGSGEAIAKSTKPDKGDTEAAVEAALNGAIKKATEVIKTNARQP